MFVFISDHKCLSLVYWRKTGSEGEQDFSNKICFVPTDSYKSNLNSTTQQLITPFQLLTTNFIHHLQQLSSNITSPVLDDAPSYVAHQNPWRPSPDTPEVCWGYWGWRGDSNSPWVGISDSQSWREVLLAMMVDDPNFNVFIISSLNYSDFFYMWTWWSMLKFHCLTPSIRDLVLVFNIFSLIFQNGSSPRSLEIFPKRTLQRPFFLEFEKDKFAKESM